MHEEKLSVLGKRRPAQARHELDMATAILHALAQFIGPAGQFKGAGTGAPARRFQMPKIEPMLTATSMFEDPSSGSI